MKTIGIDISGEFNIIETNLTKNEMQIALRKGREKLDLDSTLILDPSIPTIDEDELEILIKAGFKILPEYDYRGPDQWVSSAMQLAIYAFIIKQGNPDFVYKDMSHNILEVEL